MSAVPSKRKQYESENDNADSSNSSKSDLDESDESDANIAIDDAKDFTVNIDKLDVSCPICREILIEPATLRCGHSFCIKCLCDIPSFRDFISDCPVCKDKVLIQKEHIKINTFMNNMLKAIPGYKSHTKEYFKTKELENLLNSYTLSNLHRYLYDTIISEISSPPGYINYKDLSRYIHTSMIRGTQSLDYGINHVLNTLDKTGKIWIYKDIIFRRHFSRSVLEEYIRKNLEHLSANDVYYLMGKTYNSHMHKCDLKDAITESDEYTANFHKYLREYKSRFNEKYRDAPKTYFYSDRLDDDTFILDYRDIESDNENDNNESENNAAAQNLANRMYT